MNNMEIYIDKIWSVKIQDTFSIHHKNVMCDKKYKQPTTVNIDTIAEQLEAAETTRANTFNTRDSLRKLSEVLREEELNDGPIVLGPTKRVRFANEKNVYTCCQCGQSFNSKNGIQNHVSKQHSVDDISKTEKKHGRQHGAAARPARPAIVDLTDDDKKLHKCTMCDKGYANASNLNRHVQTIHGRRHTRDRPFVCRVCSSRFSRLANLRRHQNVHAKAKPLECDCCEKTLILYTGLAAHAGRRPYLCEWCGKTYACTATYFVHRRSHTGETPHACPVCGKRFEFLHKSCLRAYCRAHVRRAGKTSS